MNTCLRPTCRQWCRARVRSVTVSHHSISGIFLPVHSLNFFPSRFPKLFNIRAGFREVSVMSACQTRVVITAQGTPM